MLYIIDIDSYSFGVSGAGIEIADIESVYPKLYYAKSIDAVGDAEDGLVSIRHKEEDSNLVSLAKPEDITLDGVVYDTANNFAIAFNAFIQNATPATTTTVAPTTTTTEEPTTTTTTEAVTTTTTVA